MHEASGPMACDGWPRQAQPSQAQPSQQQAHLTVSRVTLPDASVSTLRSPISCIASRRVLTSRPAAGIGSF